MKLARNFRLAGTLALGLTLTGCMTTENPGSSAAPGTSATKPVTTKQSGLTDRALPFTEVARLTSLCAEHMADGAERDLTASGYRFYSGSSPFFLKSVSKDAQNVSYAPNDLSSALLSYAGRGCEVSFSAPGGRGDEQPFMASITTATEASLRRLGFQPRDYTLSRGQKGVVWVRGTIGLGIVVSGTAGSRAAKVQFSPPFPSVRESMGLTN